MNRQAILCSVVAAVVVSGLLTLASWATGATLMFLAPIVGCAAGLGLLGGGGPSVRRSSPLLRGVTAAAITLVAILGGRVVLGWLDAGRWAERLAEVSHDDLESELAGRIAAEAIERGELEEEFEEYPDWVLDEARDRLAAMDEDEVAALTQELHGESEEALSEVAPILIVIQTLVNIGFLGVACIGLALGTAYRVGGQECESDDRELDETMLKDVPTRAIVTPTRAPLPEDPLAGTAEGARSLTGASDSTEEGKTRRAA